MIEVIADSIEELNLIKNIVDIGTINLRVNQDTDISVNYSLVSGNPILFNNYNNILGERLQDGTNRFIKSYEDSKEE